MSSTHRSDKPEDDHDFDLSQHERSRSMLIHEFDKKFPTSSHCIDWIMKHAERSCSRCGQSVFLRMTNPRLRRCSSCKQVTRVTVGTFFEKKKCIRAWFLVFYLMANGIVENSCSLSRLLGLAQSTCANMLKTIALFVHRFRHELQTKLPTNSFSRLFARRSRETPARLHPIAESQEKYQLSPEENEAEINSGDDLGNLGSLERKLLDLLTDCPKPAEKLLSLVQESTAEVAAALTMLELYGFAQRLPGDQYVRSSAIPKDSHDIPEKDHQREYVKHVSKFIESRFQKISRKCLDLYVAAFRCFINKDEWVDDILIVCIKALPIRYADIVNHVTDEFVFVA